MALALGRMAIAREADTAALARGAGATVLERQEQSRRGKGYALEFAFRRSREARFADAVVVVDADLRVGALWHGRYDLASAAAARLLQEDVPPEMSRAQLRFARFAYGGLAAIPKRAVKTEALLLGDVLGDTLVERARASLVAEFTPLSDHRGEADYRRALAGNLFVKFVAEKLA